MISNMIVNERFTINNPFTGNGYSFVTLILETLVLSSFICKNITIFFTATCHCCDKADIGFEGHGMDQNLSIIVDHSKLQHVLPLTIPTEGCPPEQRTRCDAKIRCREGHITNSLITCKRSLWKYHPHCIGGEKNQATIVDAATFQRKVKGKYNLGFQSESNTLLTSIQNSKVDLINIIQHYTNSKLQFQRHRSLDSSYSSMHSYRGTFV